MARKAVKLSDRSSKKVDTSKPKNGQTTARMKCELCGEKWTGKKLKAGTKLLCPECREKPEADDVRKQHEKENGKEKPNKMDNILNWELRHQLDKKLDEMPLYLVLKWVRENGLSVNNALLSQYKKLRDAERVMMVVGESQEGDNMPGVVDGAERWATFFTQGRYDITKETIGQEMNFLNGIIKTAEHRLINFPMLVDPTEMMKAALNAIKIKGQIMGPEAYQYEKHFEALQGKVEKILTIVNEECDQETRLRIYKRLQEMQVEEMRG